MAQPNNNTDNNNNNNNNVNNNINNNINNNDNNNDQKMNDQQNDNNNNNHKHHKGCSHGHSHKHKHKHGKGCKHDHDNAGQMSYGTSLYNYIDKKNIKCLNESVSSAGKSVFKPYDERLDTLLYVESDIDGELLFTVYFTAEVTLRSIEINMDDEESAPTTLKLWNDKQDKIDFDNYSDYKCNQAIELTFDNECKLKYKTSQHKFNDLTVLKMLFQKDNYDDDEEEIRINYIGLKGDYKGPKSRRAVHTIYEAAANPSDHANIAKSKNKNAHKNDGVDGK